YPFARARSLIATSAERVLADVNQAWGEFKPEPDAIGDAGEDDGHATRSSDETGKKAAGIVQHPACARAWLAEECDVVAPVVPDQVFSSRLEDESGGVLVQGVYLCGDAR